MAQDSIFWTTDGTGDGTSGGINEERRRLHDDYFNVIDNTTMGVLSGILNELSATVTGQPSGTSDDIEINTGAAMCYGFRYSNDASVTLTPTKPAIGDTGGRVVLQADWVAQTVRLTLVENTDGTAAIPALTQTAGTTWEIPICSYVIETDGDIKDTASTAGVVTDTRSFVVAPGAGIAKLATYAGDGTASNFTWTGIRQDFTNLRIVGSGRSDDTLTVSVGLNIELNGDTGNNYDRVSADTTTGGVNATSNVATTPPSLGNLTTDQASNLANAVSLFTVDIPNYTGTNLHKSLSCQSSDPTTALAGGVHTRDTRIWWRDTSAITQIKLSTTGNFKTGTVFTLYGLR